MYIKKQARFPAFKYPKVFFTTTQWDIYCNRVKVPEVVYIRSEVHNNTLIY